ncbi:MAG TPA: sodium:solute symporter [Tepidisphaeraceae bacterium]|jgi:SSS family solute:Na+ symporter|nr:sodium:solute symporter [Tepidisphaeraceae bacterium]
MNALRTPDLVVVGIYFAVVAGIGVWFSRRQKSTEDYFVARRRIPHWAIGLSVFATIISSITFIAYPGAAFKGDWNQLVPGFMAVGVLLVIGTTLVSFFRHAVGMSAYEYFEKRFGYGARAYSALAFAAGHFSKMGFVLFTTTIAICGMTGWDKFHVILGVGCVTILYTLIGGLEAVIWTEVLQGILKITGVFVVIGVLIHLMPGGFSAAYHLASEKNKFSLGHFNFNLAADDNFWVMILYGTFWYLQKYAADQTLVQRYLVAKTDRDALKGVAMGAVLCVPAWTAFMLIGTLLWAYYQLSNQTLPANLYDAKHQIITDQVFPYFLTTKIPAGLAGIFMAAFFSAAMSTTSSDLNCLSAVFVEDYFRKMFPESTDATRLLAGKISVAVCGAIAVGIGLFIAKKGDNALTLYYAATAIVSAGLAGMFLLAFLSRRANRKGLWIGIVVALIFTTWATLTGGKQPILHLPWNYMWPSVMVGVVAHLLVFVVGWVASFLFAAEANVKKEWTLWGWWENRSGLRAEQMPSH